MSFEFQEGKKNDEDALLEKRTLSDAELIKGGAGFEGGALVLTEDQKRRIHDAMQREHGEYTPGDKDYISRLLEGVLIEQPTYNPKNRSETRPSVNNIVIRTLLELRQINPSEFDASYKSKIDWEKVRGALELDIQDFNRFSVHQFSAVKEFFPEEFTRDVHISEDIWGKIIKDCKGALHPNKFTAMILGMGERTFMHAMTTAADIKLLDKERFGQNIVVEEEKIEQLRKLVEENDPLVKQFGAERALRILTNE